MALHYLWLSEIIFIMKGAVYQGGTGSDRLRARLRPHLTVSLWGGDGFQVRPSLPEASPLCSSEWELVVLFPVRQFWTFLSSLWQVAANTRHVPSGNWLHDGCSKQDTGLPWGLSAKESVCQCRGVGFDPWIGKISWRREWQPTPRVLALGNPTNRGAWWATVHGVAKSRTGVSDGAR